MCSMEPTQRYWFPAKRYGWGWGAPRTWEGWLVLATFSVVMIGPAVLFPRWAGPLVLITAAVATPLLLWVCLKRGEPTRWRWGGE